MKYYKISVLFILILVAVFSIGVVYLKIINQTEKSAIAAGCWYENDRNMHGFAWSSNYGWVSFNSGDCHVNSQCKIDSAAAPGCPIGLDISNGNYGVKIDNVTRNLSGEAWNSSSTGWIYFERITVCEDNKTKKCDTDTDCGGAPGSCQNINPPTAPFNTGSGPIARLDENEILRGWAYILSLGDDGWLSLSTSTDADIDYEVKYNDDGSVTGMAWNGNDGKRDMEWLSFSCNDYKRCDSTSGNKAYQNCTVNADCNPGICENTCTAAVNPSNYGVSVTDLNRRPRITNMRSPNSYFQDAAINTNGVRGAVNLTWGYDDDGAGHGTEYTVYMEEVGSSPLKTITKTCNGNNANDGDDCGPLSIDCLTNGENCIFTPWLFDDDFLNYGKQYIWRVMAIDDEDLESIDTAYNTVPDTSSSSDKDLVDSVFRTYYHEMPEGHIIYFPEKPSLGEDIRFSATSTFYYTAAFPNSSKQPCMTCTYEWFFEGGGAINYLYSSGNTGTTTYVKFSSPGSVTVRLRVTDQSPEHYEMTTTTVMTIGNQRMPTWKETK